MTSENSKGALKESVAKRKADRRRLVSYLVHSGLEEERAQNVVETLFSNEKKDNAERQRLVAKILAGELQNSSLIKMFEQENASSRDEVKAASFVRRNKKRDHG